MTDAYGCTSGCANARDMCRYDKISRGNCRVRDDPYLIALHLDFKFWGLLVNSFVCFWPRFRS